MNVLVGSILVEIKKWRNVFVHLPDYFVPRSQEENVTKKTTGSVHSKLKLLSVFNEPSKLKASDVGNSLR